MYNEFISIDGQVILDEWGKFRRWNTSSVPPQIEREGYFLQDTSEDYQYE